MKKASILLVFFISSLLSNDLLNDLFVNDPPVWIEIPQQTIDEDCQSGCVNGIFSFDLLPFIDDPDGDFITILEPNLISGQTEELFIDSYILNINPSQNFYGNIIIEIIANDGELSTSTQLIY